MNLIKIQFVSIFLVSGIYYTPLMEKGSSEQGLPEALTPEFKGLSCSYHKTNHSSYIEQARFLSGRDNFPVCFSKDGIGVTEAMIPDNLNLEWILSIFDDTQCSHSEIQEDKQNPPVCIHLTKNPKESVERLKYLNYLIDILRAMSSIESQSHEQQALDFNLLRQKKVSPDHTTSNPRFNTCSITLDAYPGFLVNISLKNPSRLDDTLDLVEMDEGDDYCPDMDDIEEGIIEERPRDFVVDVADYINQGTVKSLTITRIQTQQSLSFKFNETLSLVKRHALCNYIFARILEELPSVFTGMDGNA